MLHTFCNQQMWPYLDHIKITGNMENNNRALMRAMFGTYWKLLYTKLQKTQKCGIFPFDADAIDYQKCMTHESKVVGTEGNARPILKPTNFKVMEPEQAEEFRKCYSTGWTEGDCAKELFNVWKNYGRDVSSQKRA
ncbi:hypothetical protein PR048_012414 [Dryococelus australis]|uniref:Uncharacterized protein n=1 Tax=Dryococelus australis TaxID=614101 RepID=A0ABQ9HPL0_9NEOP|nr:hypothetical protein PR048_012414 [Dryococelus australis]